MSESKRLIDLLNATDEFFKSKGIDSPRRNAETLFAKALDLSRVDLYLQFERPLSEIEMNVVRELIRRRTRREPLQYIIGFVEFLDARIDLRPGVLIPRPETAELVLAFASNISKESRVLDLCCGSGCISVALAKQGLNVVGIDIDPVALEVTKHNASINGVSDRVKTAKVDIFDPTLGGLLDEPFDGVIANPPYIRADEYPSLEPEVREFENEYALVSGPSGDEFHIRISELLPSILKNGGLFGLEFGIGQAARVRELFAPHLSELTINRDMQGKERFLLGRR